MYFGSCGFTCGHEHIKVSVKGIFINVFVSHFNCINDLFEHPAVCSFKKSPQSIFYLGHP